MPAAAKTAVAEAFKRSLGEELLEKWALGCIDV